MHDHWAGRGGAEFPAGATDAPAGLSRRAFLKLLGASAALAGAGACTEPPPEKILPYADQPPELTPGIPRYYATSMVLGGYATGLLVESHTGRPVKVEGNPEHPASLGAAGVYEQASPLQLYDPGRGRGTQQRGQPASWAALVQALGLGSGGGTRFGSRGEGLAFLLEPTSSPLVLALLDAVRTRYPAARVHFHDPLAAEGALLGSRLLYGRPLQPRYDLARAAVLVSLDADFLAGMPFHLRYAHDFAARRRITSPDGRMNRLYAAEGAWSATGAMADHRLRVRTGEVREAAAALLGALALRERRAPAALDAAALNSLRGLSVAPAVRAWAEAAAHDLALHRGEGVVIAGERQPPEVHALAHLLNDAAGNLGRTVWMTEPVLAGAGDPAVGLAALADAVRGGAVQTLVVLEGNPAYTAPADLDLGRLVRRVPQSVYLGLYADETAAACEWYVPARHYLESWGDARAYDGTLSLVQPLIRPLYPEARAPGDLLALFAGRAGSSQHDLLRETWRRRAAGDFEGFWEAALRRGFLPGTEAPPVAAAPSGAPLAALLAPAAPAGAGIELVFPRDASVYDGRFANLAWLQELPDPLSKLTWDNAALLSPRTATRLGVESGELLELRREGRAVRAPALVLPGLADEQVALHLGYGRGGAEALAAGVGVNANLLRTTAAPYFAGGAAVERVLDGAGQPLRHALALTQEHWSLEGRPVALHASLAEYGRNPEFARGQRGRTLSLYQPFAYRGEQWAMSIDLSLCTGCSACVVACQAENNVPVVGKDGVLKSREMHWLRVDRYFSGDPDEPLVLAQPMMCQHCEKAPCEYVCPVNATTHSPDGLNEMTYNRCVGTRFCSNNCPYKVRRFNWFAYNAEKPETERMLMNPDVTVRSRGVMEKCTYCVQRIRRHQIDAQTGRADPTVQPLQTACQQSCPTRAIVFGSLGDAGSEVARMRAEPRAYSALHELGTEPRTRYLARITNPNPLLAGPAPREDG